MLAVLTVQFARTIALALTITKFSKKFADRNLLPIVTNVTSQEYRVSKQIRIRHARGNEK